MLPFVSSIFKNRHGKVVIWQSPNIPLWGWIFCVIFSHILTHGKLHAGISSLGTASIFTWAYLEVRSGDSLFRRILGGLVLAIVIIGFFK